MNQKETLERIEQLTREAKLKLIEADLLAKTLKFPTPTSIPTETVPETTRWDNSSTNCADQWDDSGCIDY